MPLDVPTIAVFYAPVEVKDSSEVFYRETRNESIVKRATDHVRASFSREKNFVATSVFIATWNNVVHVDGRFPNKVRSLRQNPKSGFLITVGKPNRDTS